MFRYSLCAVAVLAIAACNNDSTTSPTTSVNRSYNQVQRLGNPLVSEVFLRKADHPYHATIGPDQDVAAFSGDVKGFVAAFRPNATTAQNTLAAVLLPDMLIIQTNKATNTAGWLSWALADGWGGRKINDDAVDIGLSGIFSSLLDSTESVCAPFTLPLCTDNVGPHETPAATFPYLTAPK